MVHEPSIMVSQGVAGESQHTGWPQHQRYPVCLSRELIVLTLRMQSVTFHVSIITDGEAAIKTRQGVANGVEEDSATEPGMLLTNVPAGTKLSDVALFVDSNNMALGPQAHTKWWQ